MPDGTKRFIVPQLDIKHTYYGASPKVKRPKIKRVKVTKVIGIKKPQTWLEIHKGMLRWQKTPEFARWRRKQFLRQGGTCYYCDELLVGRKENIEHVIPKYRGGDNRKSNLVIACATCNKEKNTTILSYRQRQALKEKNRKKKGTYHKVQHLFKTEQAVAYELGQMFPVE